jgi:hypothetical protein
MGNLLTDDTEVPSHTWAPRFECFEPGAAPGGMNADTFGVVVVNGNKDCDLMLAARP